MVFSVGGGPKCRSAVLFPCSSAYAVTVLSIYSLCHMITVPFIFFIMKLATNKNIVLLPIMQITFNSSSLAPWTAMMQHRLDSVLGLGWRGGRETVLASL